LLKYLDPESHDTILDLGAAGDYYGEQPFFEDAYPWKENIIGVNIDLNELTSLRTKHKQVALVLADGCCLPFRSKSIDVLFSNAVIEHVGSLRRQRRFAGEIMRISKRWFVTTPNFWFPIETHWKLPFIHFLPEKTQRQIMDSGKRLFVERSPEYSDLTHNVLLRSLRRYFSEHSWHGQGLHLLSTTKLQELFPTSKIKKQRTTFYPEVLLAYCNSSDSVERSGYSEMITKGAAS
jgi:ubiquinone/menaquinone biosynthesis C-methylase UbiE